MNLVLAWMQSCGPMALVIVALFAFAYWNPPSAREGWDSRGYVRGTDKPFTEADWERGAQDAKRWLAALRGGG